MDSLPTNPSPVRVQFSSVEDARRAVFSMLGDIPEQKRARLAGEIVGRLRDLGALASSVEQHYSALDVDKDCQPGH